MRERGRKTERRTEDREMEILVEVCFSAPLILFSVICLAICMETNSSDECNSQQKADPM